VKSGSGASAPRRTGAARIRSFAPIARRDARILLLGSMPGAASLAAGRYYAHPRNAFWRILGELLGFDPQAPYPARARALRAAHVALWDVLHSCLRRGSLDTMIVNDSETANDFHAFFRAHPRIDTVCFNGAKAEASFRRHVLPGIGAGLRPGLRYLRLPSTSPAHAGLSYERKLAAWRAILPHERTPRS
jgi:double-stranded uracil-DNA glycosylase